ncbi:hypothetical protein BDCR2A_01776 [Borrelia duttonii CR2A]|uniref:Uncharacterized protein n=1 Tax=Borrelia duttonii CR2A TaxID=1432657 RepID=W6TG51_9SPIR|nr:hypothetical protein BDCR2A_01776 [Borrelia duttonii CR2A]
MIAFILITEAKNMIYMTHTILQIKKESSFALIN